MAAKQQQREKQYLTLLEFELDPDKETEKAYRVKLPLYHFGQRAGVRTSRWMYIPKSAVNWLDDDTMQVEAWIVAAKEEEIATTVFNGDKVEVLCREGETVRKEMAKKEAAPPASHADHPPQEARQAYQQPRQQQAPAATQQRRYEPELEPVENEEEGTQAEEGPDDANDYWF